MFSARTISHQSSSGFSSGAVALATPSVVATPAAAAQLVAHGESLREAV